MTEADLSLRLETALRRLTNDNIIVSRDLISRAPTEAIALGLEQLYARNIIGAEDVSAMSVEYDFGNASLREVMADSLNVEVLEELIARLKAMKENL